MPFDPTSLTYDSRGLIPCIAQEATTGEVLMLAWMNRESVARTLETGLVTYWSRSRGEFWVKGATSGHRQHLVALRIDCDRDCLLALVRQEGPACHTGRRSCFFTELRDGVEIDLPEIQPRHPADILGRGAVITIT
ncbi:MAG: phosphoribosyl-AMP cyclohydrolase [Rubellimicrobium sp.]|nr:phosphoribosyl-AMP cyclohydrolase [Rubellimicrobium sp.]